MQFRKISDAYWQQLKAKVDNQIEFYWSELKKQDIKPQKVEEPKLSETDLIKQGMYEALQKAKRIDDPNKLDCETLQMLIWWTQTALNEIFQLKQRDTEYSTEEQLKLFENLQTNPYELL